MMTLNIDTGNAAFQDGGLDYEICRILDKISADIQLGYRKGSCIDFNGNKVGSWEITND